ncbi:Protein MIZU-KUSSEI 1-like, plant [Dillenia turbinata]|uniref:Protein MIZU-KUSSEI 1-like, plant n=1 Tax=Dillenia turbinata TaxID=194707 RepID=A0AAN8V567_9MAGN
MGENKSSTISASVTFAASSPPENYRASTSSSSSISVPPPPSRPSVSLVAPSQKKKHKNVKAFRVFRSVFRSLPIIPPVCKFPGLPGGSLPDGHRTISGTRVTGTLFGYRKGRVSFSMQENPRCLPSLVVELAMQTSVLQKEMSEGMVRLALESEKRPDKDKTKILDEPLWTMYCNGKKHGYGVRREANEEDLNVMELLKAISMGAGVLPGNSEVEGPDGELAYIRAHFDRVMGSKDCETLYMISPDGNNGPELFKLQEQHPPIGDPLFLQSAMRLEIGVLSLLQDQDECYLSIDEIIKFGVNSLDRGLKTGIHFTAARCPQRLVVSRGAPSQAK